jgi:hypothetical protein
MARCMVVVGVSAVLLIVLAATAGAVPKAEPGIDLGLGWTGFTSFYGVVGLAQVWAAATTVTGGLLTGSAIWAVDYTVFGLNASGALGQMYLSIQRKSYFAAKQLHSATKNNMRLDFGLHMTP